MLLVLNAGNQRTPLLFVHGMLGILPYRRGQALADYLGSEQPVYGFEAQGFDGSRPPHNKVQTAATEYLVEARRAGAVMPYVIAGVCEGTLIALQMAQQLTVTAQFSGEPNPVRLLLLIDPPGLPGRDGNSDDRITPEVVELFRERTKSWLLERPADLPFDVRNSRQLEIAAEVGTTLEVAIGTYMPATYSGRVEILAIEKRAAMIRRPNWPWRSILTGAWNLTVLDCDHSNLFTTHAPEVFRWMKARLDELDVSPGQSPRAAPAA